MSVKNFEDARVKSSRCRPNLEYLRTERTDGDGDGVWKDRTSFRRRRRLRPDRSLEQDTEGSREDGRMSVGGCCRFRRSL
jgi:hypothetical protein